jgi:cation transport ATPase
LPYALSAAGWFPSVAVLAVACPCAFSLAGVSAITAATGTLFRAGLLAKSAVQLEELHRVRTVIFDKTGTLTEGRLEVAALAWRDAPRPELLGLVLAAEAHATHPAAHALRAHLAAQGISAAALAGIATEDLPGQGRVLRCADRSVRVGAAALFCEPFVPPGATSVHTLVWFGEGHEALGCFLLVDALRADAPQAIARLRAAGLRTELLSGDRASVCAHVAELAGLDAHRGDASLEDKVALVSARARSGERILYVGDGTNDALAMSAASASVAISGATDEALTAAGFVMLHPRLGALPELFALGRRLSRVIRGNYAWAFSFNGVFVPVAAAGYLTPLAAMLLMLLSSSAVLLNALRLRR